MLLDCLEFPLDLKVGFATASYQIEGAASLDGKGENIWDRFTHAQPSKIADGTNGDVAADSYHLYKEDVALIKMMGGQVYRFSISWSRLLPTGFAAVINPAGLQYYNNLINELIANGIEPMITLYHWDLPQPLQDLGGWTNECMVDYFGDYARVAYSNFGDRVKSWITFNEPWEICYLGYGLGVFAPGIEGKGVAEYLAGHNLLKAHAKAYHLYNDEFKSEQKGVVGITLNTMGYEPKTDDPDDVEATKRAYDFVVGWFAHPIFSESGDYPESMKKQIAAKSQAEGFPRSRLPEFDEFWLSSLRGSSDFYGMNHYTSQQISNCPKIGGGPSWRSDMSATYSQPDNWPKTSSPWFSVAPHGFRSALNFIKTKYNSPVVYITENGYSDKGELDDDARISYFYDYLKEVLNAIYKDGVNVQLYTAWSLLDDFEWNVGYTTRFGITSVDFQDPKRRRTPKKSAKYMQKIFKTRKLDPILTSV